MCAFEKTLTGHTSGVISASFSPDCSRIMSASDDNSIRIWNVASGACEKTVTVNESGCCWVLSLLSVSFSVDGTRIACGCYNGKIIIWNVVMGSCVDSVQLDESPSCVTIAAGPSDSLPLRRVNKLQEDEGSYCCVQ